MPLLTRDKLFRHIETRLGLVGLKLPFEDDYILDVIEQETLPTFSQYFPNVANLKIDMSEDKADEEHTYFLPIEKYEREDIYVLSISKIVKSASTAFGRLDMMNMGTEGLMSLQGASDMVSMEDDYGTNWKFIPPNKVKFDKVPSHSNGDKIILECFITHATNFRTIKPSMAEGFKKLAILDVKIALWETLKRYNKINTTYGMIDLKIDDWEGAEDERESLLDRWEDDSVYDSKYHVFTM